MADNIKVKGSTEDVAVNVATDEVAGRHFPVYKQATGPEGAEPVHLSTSNPMPVIDYLLEVAQDNIPKNEVTVVSGKNANVGIFHADIWDGGILSNLDYDAQTANFTPGLLLTGGTSGATGTIVCDDDDGATGTLCIRNIVGIFVNDEIITDSGTGSATADGVPASLRALVYPTVGETWEILSESTDDAAAGTGARTVTITYLNDSHVRVQETKTLNGQTAVTFTATDAYRFESASVDTFGSATHPVFAKTNLGTIIIRDSTSKDVRGLIVFDDSIAGDVHGLNSSRDIHYTVPANTVSTLTNVDINTSKNHEIEGALLIRFPGNEGFSNVGELDVYQSSVSLNKLNSPFSLPAESDVKVIARSNNTSVVVNALLTFLERDIS